VGVTTGLRNVPNDLAYVARTLVKAPVTVAITVLSLGLGIGAVTTVFAVADALLYPPAVGLREPEALLTIYRSEDDGEAYGMASFADYERVRETAAVEDAAAMALGLIGLELGDERETLVAERVSANYFSVTGIQPVLGRAFTPGPSSEDGARVVVLGHGLWTRRFGADPGIISRSLSLDGMPYTVIGIAPEGIVSRRAPVRPDLWIPLGATDVATTSREATRPEYLILARLADHAEGSQLRVELDVLAARLGDDDPEGWMDDRGELRRFSAVPERESRLNPQGRIILGAVAAFFFGIAGLILLIAAANVTSLFLVRARRRSREIAVRIALGASRLRIVSLLLLEGVLLGVVAGIVGVGFAAAVTDLLAAASLPIDIPIRFEFEVAGRARVVAFVTALATGVVFSLVPAWGISRPDLAQTLKGGTRAWPKLRGRGRLRDALVVVQFAAALVLIVGAGLFTRSLNEARSAELGVDPDGVAVMTKRVPEELGADEVVAYYGEVLSRLEGTPGARAAALSRGLELTLLQVGTPVSVTALPGDPEGRLAYRNSVTPGYLEMLSIPLLRGRSLTDDDGPEAPRVAVVSETFATRWWPDGDALGRRVSLRDRSPGTTEREPIEFEVVGIAGDAAYLDIGDPPTPYIWSSLYQDPARTVAITLAGTSADAMATELSSRIELDPGEVPLVAPTTYRSQLSLQYVHLRLASSVLGWGGGFGLFLGLIGVYGVVSFVVAERTREMAIRLAIGAHGGDLVRRLVRYALVLAAVGSAVGLLLVLPAAHLLRSVLVGVGPADPLSLIGGLGLLFATAALAAFVPARRATRIDPMLTLREE
jgi:predicted permease